MKRILAFGATSKIAEHVLRLFAQDKAQLFLVARNEERLSAIADDLRAQGASKVETLAADFCDFSRHGAIVQAGWDSLREPDLVFIAHGWLGEQKAAESSYAAAEEILRVNFLSNVSLLTDIANRMERQRSGKIMVISSVAGDRGRKKIYVYGSAKAGLTHFLQGLGHRLAGAGVSVITIKPGIVDTPMTQGVKKGLLMAKPERVARRIYRAASGRTREVYVPFFWRFIMAIIRRIPGPVFRHMEF